MGHATLSPSHDFQGGIGESKQTSAEVIMSIPDCQIEEPHDESDELCEIHGVHYRVGLVCGECLVDDADRIWQDKLDERGRLSGL